MGVPVNSAWPVSREDISLMKQSLVSKFNDSFSKDLVDTKKVKLVLFFFSFATVAGYFCNVVVF